MAIQTDSQITTHHVVFWFGLGSIRTIPDRIPGIGAPCPRTWAATLELGSDKAELKLRNGIGAGLLEDLALAFSPKHPASERPGLLILNHTTHRGGGRLMEKTDLIRLRPDQSDGIKEITISDVHFDAPNCYPTPPFQAWLIPGPLVLTEEVRITSGAGSAERDAGALLDHWRDTRRKMIVFKKTIYCQEGAPYWGEDETAWASECQIVALKRPGW